MTPKEAISKKLVVLAMTKMANGICAAGIESEQTNLVTGQWIRPVRLDISDPMEHCIQLTDFIIQGELQIKLLGLSEFFLKEPKPSPPHIEDWVIDRRVKPRLIKEFTDNEKLVFLNGNAHNEDLDKLTRKECSLGLIKPDDFLIHFGPNKKGDDIAVRVDFTIRKERWKDKPCPDIRLRALGRYILQYLKKPSHCLAMEDFLKKGYANIFFALGLTRLYQGENWLMVIGVHTIPEYKAKIDFSEL